MLLGLGSRVTAAVNSGMRIERCLWRMSSEQLVTGRMRSDRRYTVNVWSANRKTAL